MPRYRVTKTCFYQGCVRNPGDKHSVVYVDKPLEKVPSYLELIEEEKPAKKGKPASDDE